MKYRTCNQSWDAPIRMSENTQNISGEASEYCPVCNRKASEASPIWEKSSVRVVEEFELAIPSWALSYIINSDASGLDDDEISQVDRYMAQFETEAKSVGGYIIIVASQDEPYFSKWPEFGLACNVVDCTLLIMDNKLDLIPSDGIEEERRKS